MTGRALHGALLIAMGLVAMSATRTPADDVKIEVPTIKAADGGISQRRPLLGSSEAAQDGRGSMHPSSDNQRHFVLAARRPNMAMPVSAWPDAIPVRNAGVHETVLLDLAAAIKWLKEERGFSRIVLVGHSGGGSLMAYYQSQATTPPPGRYKATAAGDPPDLNAYEMIPADGRRDPQCLRRRGPACRASPRSVGSSRRRSVVDRSGAGHVQPGQRLFASRRP